MKQKDLVFLDLDGTILDYKLRAYKTFVEVIGGQVEEDLTFETYVQQRRNGVSNFELYSSLLSPNIDEKAFHSKWHLLIEEIDFLNHDVLFSDTLSWIADHSERTRMVLCTARRVKRNLLKQLENLGIGDAFQKVLVSEGKFTKYELLKSYLAGTQDLHRDMYFLGDTLEDMLAGKSVGAKVSFVERGFTPYLSLIGIHVDSNTDNLPRIPY